MSKENIFLNKKWLESHLKEIKVKAGSRYTPELNVELPVSDIFNWLARTPDFYFSIREHYGKFQRARNYVVPKHSDERLTKIIQNLNEHLAQLEGHLARIKEYDTGPISWAKIGFNSRKAADFSWNLIEEMRNIRDELKANESLYEEIKEKYYQHEDIYSSEIHHLHELQKELRYFEDISSSTKAKLSNKPFLLLTGLAGTGKTHLLSDVSAIRIGKTYPTVMFFGEHFRGSKSAWSQIIGQLKIDNIKRHRKLLRLLDEKGEKLQARALIIIDALNESDLGFWKKNIDSLVKEIKQYHNIGLVVSIRTGFEKDTLKSTQIKYFAKEEHHGFMFREWEAVTKFFKEFNIPLPEIPLLMPEFQNPLFLLLFCKGIEKRGKHKKTKQSFRGHEGATYIFEQFVKNTADRIAKEFNLPPGRDYKGRYVIWDTVIDQIASKMVSNKKHKDRISERDLEKIVQSAYPKINFRELIKSLEQKFLITKVPKYTNGRESGYEFRFPFQKFSGHLITRYLLNKYLKGKTDKIFQKNGVIGKIIADPWNRELIESLSIQIPERLNGKELVDVAPWIADSFAAQEAFIESLIWRKPTCFATDKKCRPSNALNYINSSIIKTNDDRFNRLLNAFLTVSSIPGHPFNSDLLHNHLMKFDMANRDAWWSTFLHYQYWEQDAVRRLVEWAWSEQEKLHISDEAIRLSAVALAWFLTASNRFLRDKATKALVALLSDRLPIVKQVLEQFKNVNDPYVAERLYAVAYGCVLRNQVDKDNLERLAHWVYENIFKDENPPIHILLRDYARGIIETALYRKIKLNIDVNKIRPPYKSKWTKKIPSNDEIKKYEFNYKSKNFKDFYWSQNTIIHSMQPEHSEIFMYGDFGRYVFQNALSHWNTDINFQQLSNLAVQRVFELGYNVDLHGKFDRSVNYNRTDRSGHKAERIGKKYQWIAFHEILAMVSDNFEFLEDTFAHKLGSYEGPWNPLVRDIDPSCLLERKLDDSDNVNICWWAPINYDQWALDIEDSEWLKTKNDLPNPAEVISVIDENREEWLVLEEFIRWQQKVPPEDERYQIPRRDLWYMIKSYVVRKKDHAEFFEWAKKQNFMGRWMPESREFYEVFLREYPWASAFNHINAPGYYRYGWIKNDYSKVPVKVLLTSDEYLKEGNVEDCSVDDSIHIQLPAHWIIKQMNLNPTANDGEFVNANQNIVAFDPSIRLPGPMALLVNKKPFNRFLEENDYAIVWTILGEKIMIGGFPSSKDWKGRLEISGAYTLSKSGFDGKVTAKYRSN